MMHGCDARNPYMIFQGSPAQKEAIDPKKHVQQLDDVVFRLQYAACSVLYKTKTLKLNLSGSQSDPLPFFKVCLPCYILLKPSG